jgi:hypothetical protein
MKQAKIILAVSEQNDPIDILLPIVFENPLVVVEILPSTPP